MSKSYIQSIDDGYSSLINRFNKYHQDSELTIDDILNKLNDSEFNECKDVLISLSEQYKRECNFYLEHISEMNQYEIEAFIWHVVMKLDFIRGLFPGLESKFSSIINPMLVEFENNMWATINNYFDV